MRGNPVPVSRASARCRSIPAHAGQPPASPVRLAGLPVYPRACGATWMTAESRGSSRGLSPRMRGNLLAASGQSLPMRSIPAHAGQPLTPCCRPCRNSVYPRACGATHVTEEDDSQLEGLSPRMRGNQWRTNWKPNNRRSIPAHAGQPMTIICITFLLPVYPRACGATKAYCGIPPSMQGLSPRMRGNRWASAAGSRRVRSIPAHAGQPPELSRCGTSGGVYPRACGATAS